MDVPHGRAPVALHDLMHALSTCYDSRPKPRADKSDECVAVPVEISILATDSEGRSVHLILPCSEWALHPAGGGRPPRLTLCAVVEAPYILSDPTAPPPAEDVIESAPQPDGPHTIPELAKYPPEVFATNPGAVNAALREIAKKGMNKDGNKEEGASSG
jgi:hypothetical protein